VHYYVGVMNHGKYYNLFNGPDVKASVKIQLKEGVQPAVLGRQAELLDPFRSLQSLQAFFSAKSDEQFVYEAPCPQDHAKPKQLAINLFKDRFTLVRVWNVAIHDALELTFSAGAPVKHVLTARDQTPRTLFDFEHTHETFPTIRVKSTEANSVWFAIFATEATKATVTVTGLDDPRADNSELKHQSLMVALKTIVMFACGILALYTCCKVWVQQQKASRGYGRGSSTESAPLHYPRGFDPADQELIDPVTERQHMHRGGFGDDGI
jgi:hypothetical protein